MQYWWLLSEEGEEGLVNTRSQACKAPWTLLTQRDEWGRWKQDTRQVNTSLESLVPLPMEFTDTGDCTSPWAGGGRGGTQEWEEPKKGNLGGAPEIQALQLVGVGQPSFKLISSLRLWAMALERNWRKFEAVISRGLWGSRAAATSPWARWLLGERSPHHGARLIPKVSERKLRHTGLVLVQRLRQKPRNRPAKGRF